MERSMYLVQTVHSCTKSPWYLHTTFTKRTSTCTMVKMQGYSIHSRSHGYEGTTLMARVCIVSFKGLFTRPCYAMHLDRDNLPITCMHKRPYHTTNYVMIKRYVTLYTQLHYYTILYYATVYFVSTPSHNILMATESYRDFHASGCRIIAFTMFWFCKLLCLTKFFFLTVLSVQSFRPSLDTLCETNKKQTQILL